MTLCSYGHSPIDDHQDQHRSLLLADLDLVLKHQNHILACRDYFFITVDCAWCSWPYIGGDGPLPLGYLIFGWKTNCLTEACVDCGSRILLISFGGSPLSGSNSWSGICECCKTVKRGQHSGNFSRWLHLILYMRKNFPAQIKTWQEYDGHIFSWGGTGLTPSRKRQLVYKPTANPIALEELFLELSTNELRPLDPPNVALLKEPLTLKFSAGDSLGTTCSVQESP